MRIEITPHKKEDKEKARGIEIFFVHLWKNTDNNEFKKMILLSLMKYGKFIKHLKVI